MYTPAEDGKVVVVNFENVEDKTLAKMQKTLAETNGKLYLCIVWNKTNIGYFFWDTFLSALSWVRTIVYFATYL